MEKPMLPDQDVLNLVCKERVRFIHPSWNCMEWMAKPERPHVKILHFTEKKPWDFRYSGGNGGCVRPGERGESQSLRHSDACP
jgi:lipopolysaccharide biosynthesis glycosyltransferase